MTWGAVGAIGSIAAPLIGGMLSSDASQSAADTQAGAARYAADLQNQRYQQTRQDLMPYMQMGPQALSNLEALMGFGPIGGMGGGYGAGAMGGGMNQGAGTGMGATPGGMYTNPATGQVYSPSAEMSIAGHPRGTGGPKAAVRFDPSGMAYTQGNTAPNVYGTQTPQRTYLQQVGAAPGAATGLAPGATLPGAAVGGVGSAASGGGMALGGFSRDAMMQALQANPAYQFNLQQGQSAIDKASAARGMYYAPTTLQELGTFAQGQASQEYGNIWNRLFNMTGMGQNAATQTGQFGANAATQAGNLGIQGANAQAAGIMGQNQAYQGMIGGVTGALNNPNTQAWLSSLYGGGSGVSPAFGGNAGIF